MKKDMIDCSPFPQLSEHIDELESITPRRIKLSFVEIIFLKILHANKVTLYIGTTFL